MSNQSTFGHMRQYLWLSAFMRDQLRAAESISYGIAPESIIYDVAHALSDSLAADNPTFNRDLFLFKCGVTQLPDLKPETEKCQPITQS